MIGTAFDDIAMQRFYALGIAAAGAETARKIDGDVVAADCNAVHVQAIAAEAVLLARRQLARELPRLYDVIRGLEESRFQVEHAA